MLVHLEITLLIIHELTEKNTPGMQECCTTQANLVHYTQKAGFKYQIFLPQASKKLADMARTTVVLYLEYRDVENTKPAH